MLARAIPGDGDIVIRQDRREGRVVFILQIAPGPDQFLLHTREEAVARAVTFARRQGLRAWLSNGGDDCMLLSDFRVVALSRS
jgi:hypothetical protein